MEEKIHAPTIGELPTLRQLARATIIAAGVATVLLYGVVLPAEYGIDPTGVGRAIGLTEMGEVKRQQALAAQGAAGGGQAAPNDASADAVYATPVTTPQQGDVSLTLQPGEGSEVKATMIAGQEMDYQWSAGAAVHFELHGEPRGAAPGDYMSYETGTAPEKSGHFRAPFDGTHGWYWRNDTQAPVTVRVQASGIFQRFARVVRPPR
jgi:hypothetical protein